MTAVESSSDQQHKIISLFLLTGTSERFIGINLGHKSAGAFFVSIRAVRGNKQMFSRVTDLTVMIVDDVSVMRGLLRRILEANGYQVIAEAADGVEAVAKYTDLRPEITIMDVCLPNKNGIDATKDIVLLNGDAKVVMFSALDRDALVRAAQEAGASDFICKPCNIDQLKDTLHKVMHS